MSGMTVDKEAKAAAKGCILRRPEPHELFLDLDDEAACRTLWENLPIVDAAGPGRVLRVEVTPSPSGAPWHYHAVVALDRPVTSFRERVLLQSLLGSDRMHEALALREIAAGLPDATVLFELPPAGPPLPAYEA